jgi:hypothetical protein
MTKELKTAQQLSDMIVSPLWYSFHELEIVPSGGKRKQELRMFGLKRPTRIDLRSNDAAIVVRENGEMEMFIRQAKGDEELPPGQVVLALFGMAFHDERVRKLLAQIVKEKQNLT